MKPNGEDNIKVEGPTGYHPPMPGPGGNCGVSRPIEVPPPATESQHELRAMIKKEVDDGIKNVVLPVIESHMKHFADGFQQLIAKEVALLKQTVEHETATMQGTSKTFEQFIEKLMETSWRFTNSLDKQMQELTLTAKQQLTALPSQPMYRQPVPPAPAENQWGAPRMQFDFTRPTPIDYGRARPFEVPQPSQEYMRPPPTSEYGRPRPYEHEQPQLSGEYGRPRPFEFPQSMGGEFIRHPAPGIPTIPQGYMSGAPSTSQGK